MRHRNNAVLCASLVLLLIVAACSKADVSGTWNGTMHGSAAQKTGTAKVVATLQPQSHGITGTLTYHGATGAWDLMEGNTLTVRSGDITGSRVSFVADQNLPGGTVTLDFKGKVEGTTMKGVADLTIGSVMGGDTFVGELDLTR